MTRDRTSIAYALATVVIGLLTINGFVLLRRCHQLQAEVDRCSQRMLQIPTVEPFPGQILKWVYPDSQTVTSTDGFSIAGPPITGAETPQRVFENTLAISATSLKASVTRTCDLRIDGIFGLDEIARNVGAKPMAQGWRGHKRLVLLDTQSGHGYDGLELIRRSNRFYRQRRLAANSRWW